MARVCRQNEEPPDGWVYTEPATGGRFKCDNLPELVSVVAGHRAWKGLEPCDEESVQLLVERQICAAQFPGICRAENGEDYIPLVDKSRGLDPDKVLSFTQAAFRFVGSGGKIVDKAESERRATICRGCQYNKTSVCFCTPILKTLDAMIPSVRREPGLHICGICGCGLGVKVLLPLETVQSEDLGKNLRYPSHCWMNTPDVP